MKLAIITDIHFSGVGPDRFDTRPLVAHFVDWASRLKVDVLIMTRYANPSGQAARRRFGYPATCTGTAYRKSLA